MRLCRFSDDRLGVVDGDMLLDVTPALDVIPRQGWPLAMGDPLIANLEAVSERVRELSADAPRRGLSEVQLSSPISWPTKILAAPANYRAHVEQDTLDPMVDQGFHRNAVINLERPVDTYGLFLKASSSLVGPAQGIELPFSDRRCDHEVELAAIIGRRARHVDRSEALSYVAGYAIGLDITVRGPEERSFRKSADSFSVLGPWITTSDEIADPLVLELWLEVNGRPRQRSSTGKMTVGIAELIEIASTIYTLYPGDILMTGTPEGVGQILPGDTIRAGCAGLGTMTIGVRMGPDSSTIGAQKAE